MDKLDQVPDAVKAGCRSFKLYMAYGLKLDDGQLLKAIDAVHRAGALPVVHAENWDVITTLIESNLAQGNSSPHWHPRSRPTLFEAENYHAKPLTTIAQPCRQLAKVIIHTMLCRINDPQLPGKKIMLDFVSKIRESSIIS